MTTAELIASPGHGPKGPEGSTQLFPTPSHSPRGRSLRSALAVLLGLGFAAAALAGLFAAGLAPKLARRAALDSEAAEARTRPAGVTLTTPRRANHVSTLVLPGDIQAIRETAIHARTDGYLKRWTADIGDFVKEGDLLAEIDTPEVDQSLKEAQATLAQSVANVALAESRLQLANVTLSRSRALSARGAAPEQELDENRANARVAEATLDAAKAEVAAKRTSVQRYTQLQSFQKVFAPFAGVITHRYVDPGALISSGGNGPESDLFRLAQTDTLRVFVSVPQAYVASVLVGQEANLLVREYPDRKFVGKVVRTSGAIDPTSRTLRVEVHAPNEDHVLYSGMYVEVKFLLDRATPPLVIPANTVVVGTEGTRVAVLTPENRVHYQKVQLGRDFGAEVEVLAGLDGKEALIADPGDNLPEGARAQPVAPEKPKAKSE